MLSHTRTLFRLFSTLKYTPDHQWVSYNPTSKSIKIGITNFAKDSLGQIVYVEFKNPNTEVKKGQEILTLESVKAVGKVNSPVDGKVIAQNDKVAANQEEEFAQTEANKLWLIELQVKEEPKGLLSEKEYQELIKDLKP